MNKLQYLALLGNVNKSCLWINFGDGFCVEQWERQKFIEFLGHLHGIPQQEIELRLDESYGYGYLKNARPPNVFVVTKEFEWPFELNSNSLRKKLDTKAKTEQIDDMIREFAAMEREGKILDEKILKLRIFSEGSIKKAVELFYSFDGQEDVLQYSSEDTLHCEHRLYKISKSSVDSLNAFLASVSLTPKNDYLSLALEHFQESYRTSQMELEFLILMIALESLFNDGQQELRYKLSRGCAILLGKTIEEFRGIYKDIAGFYDKRSKLVHTGNKKNIAERDVLLLKKYTRGCLMRMLKLDLSKATLSQEFLSKGFGAYRTIGLTVKR